jgi:hypothetical protein
MLFGWGSRRHMRRGLPPRELKFLSDFYEDYIRAMYPQPDADAPEDDEPYDHDSEVIIVPASMPD